MIGLLINQSESSQIAVTADDVAINPKSLPGNIFWYSDNPTMRQKEVASWSGLMGDVFRLQPNMTPRKAKAACKVMEDAIPAEFRIHGKNLRSAMYASLPALFKLVDPLPEQASSKFLDSLTVNRQGPGYAHTTDILKNAKLDDFMLPERINRTKIIPSGSTGQKLGVYHVQCSGMTDILEPLNGKKYWVTSHQLIRLRSAGEVKFFEGAVILGDQPMIPLSEHPICQHFMEIRKGIPEGSRKFYDNLILRFLLSIPRPGAIHPYSLLLRGQSWLKACRQAQTQTNNGVKVIRFDSQAIISELDDYERNV